MKIQLSTNKLSAVRVIQYVYISIECYESLSTLLPMNHSVICLCLDIYELIIDLDRKRRIKNTY